MNSERFSRLQDVFERVSDLDGDAVPAALDTLCANDTALRREVEKLLVEASDPYLSFAAPLKVGLEDLEDEPVPKHIGSFEVIRVLGRGGMGVVYEAEQDEPRRRVALKLLRPSLAARGHRRRFRMETQLLAVLQHPGIAQIYETGAVETELGDQPWFAMELIPGEPITHYVFGRRLDIDSTLRLFIQVCDAVHYAHGQGVVHRDLKPANILVEPAEGTRGRPKILDFGVARATDDAVIPTTAATATGELVGTLPYMSPEQVGAGAPHAIDARSDVYALGVILYELLTRRLPHDVTQHPIHEAVRTICESSPARLSSIDRALRGDVETIVLKAIEKEPERRYASAEAMAADLRRFLDRQPIAARPSTALYQLRVFVRRNRAIAASIAAIFIALTLVIAVVSVALVRVARDHESARRETYRAIMLAAGGAMDRGEESSAAQMLEDTPADLRGWEWEYQSNRLERAAMIIEDPVEPGSFGPRIAVSHDGTRIASSVREGTVMVWDAASGRLIERVPVDSGGTELMRFDSDGRLIIVHGASSAAESGRDRVSTTSEGTALVEFEIPFVDFGSKNWHAYADIDHDCRWIIFPRPGDVGLLHVSTAAERHSPKIGVVARARFSPDGRRVAVSTADRRIVVLSAPDLEVLDTIDGFADTVVEIDFSPDGRLLAATVGDGTIVVVDRETRVRRVMGSPGDYAGGVYSLRFGPNGERLASGGSDRSARLWDPRSGELLGALRGHRADVFDIAFWPDGRRLATIDLHGTIRVWDLAVLEETAVLRGHHGYVNPVKHAPDGSVVVSGGWDGYDGARGAVRWWDASSGAPVAAWGDEMVALALDFSNDGTRLGVGAWTNAGPVLGGAENAVVILDARTGGVVTTLDIADAYPLSVAFDASGERVLVADQLGRIELRDVADGAIVASCELGPVRHRLWHTRAVFGPGDGMVAATGEGRSVRLLDPLDLTTIRTLPTVEDGIYEITFSSDGRHVLAACADDVARVWSTESGEPIAELRGHGGEVLSAAYSPDGARIATGSRDNTIRLWETQTYRPTAELRGHESYIYDLSFSPDGRQLFSGSGDTTLRIWDTNPVIHRLRAIDERKALVAELTPVVSSLLETNGPAAAADAIDRRYASDDRRRQVARQVFLHACIEP